MVKASSQIEQELKALQDQTEMMSASLDPLYEGYLKALGEASHRQLVMATYYLCTQAYPDRFLALSWDDRNRLQQSLQVLAAQIYNQLSQQRAQSKKMSRLRQSSDGLALLQRLLEARIASAATGKRRRSPQDGDEDRFDEDRFDEDRSLESESNSSRRQNRSTSELFGDDPGFISDASEDADEREFEEDAFDKKDPERRNSENEDFDISAFDADDADDDELSEFSAIEDSRDFDDRVDDGRGNANPDDGMTFEMEVPAAEERLSLDEEEDLLAALEGLARRSLEMKGDIRRESAGSRIDVLEDVEDDGKEDEDLTPIHLIKQQMLLERAIREVFKAVSEEANELLQKANVMPSFPRSLLAAATDSRGIGDLSNSVPNVVRVSVRVMHGEALFGSEEDDDGPRRSDDLRASEFERREQRDDNGEDRFRQSSQVRNSRDKDAARRRLPRSDGRSDGRSGRRSMRRSDGSSRRDRAGRSPRIIPQDLIEIEALPELAAISLRLSEVEFTDPTVSAWRSRLRQKLSELKKLGMRYQKTQRALETAQAEDAWRSSWTVHHPDADS